MSLFERLRQRDQRRRERRPTPRAWWNLRVRRWWVYLLVPLLGSLEYIDGVRDGHWRAVVFWMPFAMYLAFQAGYLFNERLRQLGKPGRWPLIPAPPDGWPEEYQWGGGSRR